MKIAEKERNFPRAQGDSSLLQRLSTKIIFRAKLHVASHGEVLTVLLCFCSRNLGKSGLRVSCLGLGKYYGFYWRNRWEGGSLRGYQRVTVMQVNQGLISEEGDWPALPHFHSELFLPSIPLSLSMPRDPSCSFIFSLKQKAALEEEDHAPLLLTWYTRCKHIYMCLPWTAFSLPECLSLLTSPLTN